VVEYAGGLDGWGQVVILRPAAGWRVVLAGMQATTTRTGLRVARGQSVGVMPPRPARPDLYMELRRLDRPVDPARSLNP
jgi:septal ring factor EnvC (AmiA/AmiB activator)